MSRRPFRWLVPALLLVVGVVEGTETSEETAQAQPPQQPPSKSGYEEPDVIGGGSSVGAQLIEDDGFTKPLIPIGIFREGFYALKRRLKENAGLELNVDYNYLNQNASSSTGDRRGASGSLRFYGRWRPTWIKGESLGSLVFRIENRHALGPQTPKELGFATGSSLSTAGFKKFGWGVTALYWVQGTVEERFGFAVGQMDPGDFEDIHPLLNPWTAFMNDASFNNPTTALPNQGLGVVARGFLSDHVYLKAGVNDANGDPTVIDFESFFDVQEFFTWAEIGWAPSRAREATGESIHLLAWHSDRRVEAGVPEGWGLAFSAAWKIGKRWAPFFRAGYSEGNAANLSAMVSLGTGWKIKDYGYVGSAATWARPPQAENGRDQFTLEAFYRLQLTHSVQVTPGFFWHYKPSYNPAKSSVWIASAIRIRLVL